jgi:hypothetical protein
MSVCAVVRDGEFPLYPKRLLQATQVPPAASTHTGGIVGSVSCREPCHLITLCQDRHARQQGCSLSTSLLPQTPLIPSGTLRTATGAITTERRPSAGYLHRSRPSCVRTGGAHLCLINCMCRSYLLSSFSRGATGPARIHVQPTLPAELWFWYPRPSFLTTEPEAMKGCNLSTPSRPLA